jgi:hypothetical protein
MGSYLDRDKVVMNVVSTSCSLLPRQIAYLDWLVETNKVQSKSEFIRCAIDDYTAKFNRVLINNLTPLSQEEKDKVWLERNGIKIIRRLE